MLALGSKAPSEASLQSALPIGEVLLVFFKAGCPTCRIALPFLERLHQSGRLAVYGISQDEAGATREFAETFGLTFPMLLDSADTHYPASTAYRITIVPSLFLLAADRTIEWMLEGFSRQALEDLGMAFGSPVFRPGERVPQFKPG
jgi:peroxiredoxin